MFDLQFCKISLFSVEILGFFRAMVSSGFVQLEKYFFDTVAAVDVYDFDYTIRVLPGFSMEFEMHRSGLLLRLSRETLIVHEGRTVYDLVIFLIV